MDDGETRLLYTGDFKLNASVVVLEEVIISGTAGDIKRRAQAATARATAPGSPPGSLTAARR